MSCHAMPCHALHGTAHGTACMHGTRPRASPSHFPWGGLGRAGEEKDGGEEGEKEEERMLRLKHRMPRTSTLLSRGLTGDDDQHGDAKWASDKVRD